jgi:hypothetical protein
VQPLKTAEVTGDTLQMAGSNVSMQQSISPPRVGKQSVLEG